MTIKDVAKQRLVETIVYKINRTEDPDNLKDLIQDIYVILLEKPKQFIQGLIDRNELNYYIASIAYTNICSNTSPYHRKYRRKYNHINIEQCLDQ